jgi:hypothetical protein
MRQNLSAPATMPSANYSANSEFLNSPENDLAHFDAAEEFENLSLHLEIGSWKLDVGH